MPVYIKAFIFHIIQGPKNNARQVKLLYEKNSLSILLIYKVYYLGFILYSI